MSKIFDCHTHEVYKGRSGFLIALDGIRGAKGGYGNGEVVKVARENCMIPVQYITRDMSRQVETEIIKFHPRREQYSMVDIARYIDRFKPKAVIIDTLNQPYNSPNDYWFLLKQFPEIQFLLSHAGGFDILQFIEIVMFQRNAWIDFSFTQHVFGWCGNNTMLPHVISNIDYALKNDKINCKILFGSDNIRGECDMLPEALKQYEKYDCYDRVIKYNHIKFMEESGVEL